MKALYVGKQRFQDGNYPVSSCCGMKQIYDQRELCGEMVGVWICLLCGRKQEFIA